MALFRYGRSINPTMFPQNVHKEKLINAAYKYKEQLKQIPQKAKSLEDYEYPTVFEQGCMYMTVAGLVFWWSKYNNDIAVLPFGSATGYLGQLSWVELKDHPCTRLLSDEETFEIFHRDKTGFLHSDPVIDIVSIKRRKAEKKHYCQICGSPISVGSTYQQYVNHCDGDLVVLRKHITCRQNSIYHNIRDLYNKQTKDIKQKMLNKKLKVKIDDEKKSENPWHF